MADIDDISAILGLLSSSENTETEGEDSNGGLFGDIDPEMLIKLITVFSQLNERDKNTELLTALKPHLKAENRPKVDSAVQIMKLITIMTALGGNNMFSL